MNPRQSAYMPRTALITGASTGIGYELAKLFAGDSFQLVIIAKDRDRLKKARDGITSKYNVNVIAIVQDLSLPDAPQKIYNELQKQEISVDVLINNAGIGDFSDFADSSIEKNTQMIELNCNCTTKMTRIFLDDMLKRGKGKIMNVSSIAGFFPGPHMPVYFATKAYVLHFTEAIAEELKNTKITVTALCPGPTRTPFIEAAQQEESGVIKSKKLPTAEDVALFGYNALLKGKRIAVYGFKNKFSIFLARLLPRNWTAHIVGKTQAKQK